MKYRCESDSQYMWNFREERTLDGDMRGGRYVPLVLVRLMAQTTAVVSVAVVVVAWAASSFPILARPIRVTNCWMKISGALTLVDFLRRLLLMRKSSKSCHCTEA